MMRFRHPSGRIHGLLAAVCVIAAGLLAVSCGSASNSSVSSLPTNGNTATWAELPGFTPNFIFPFTSPADYGTWNMNQFQDLMYRPLYWFGAHESPTVDYDLSLAGPPVWSDSGLAGIQLNLSQQAGQEITATDIACTPSKATPCDWQMGNWGAGWVFDPDYYPTGEDLFLTGSVANYGNYSDKANDAMINATISPHSTARVIHMPAV